MDTSSVCLRELPIDALGLPERGPDRDAGVDALAASIDALGQQVPVVVMVDVEPASAVEESYRVVDGVRRVRALQRLGRTHVAAILIPRPLSSHYEHLVNAHRRDWSPRDQLRIAAELLEAGVGATEVGRILGKDAAEVSKFRAALALRTEAPSAWRAFEVGALSVAHLKALARARDPVIRESLFARCLLDGWTARELEREVMRSKPRNESETSPDDALSAVVRSLAELFVEPERIVQIEMNESGRLSVVLGPLDAEEQQALKSWATAALTALSLAR